MESALTQALGLVRNLFGGIGNAFSSAGQQSRQTPTPFIQPQNRVNPFQTATQSPSRDTSFLSNLVSEFIQRGREGAQLTTQLATQPYTFNRFSTSPSGQAIIKLQRKMEEVQKNAPLQVSDRTPILGGASKIPIAGELISWLANLPGSSIQGMARTGQDIADRTRGQNVPPQQTIANLAQAFQIPLLFTTQGLLTRSPGLLNSSLVGGQFMGRFGVLSGLEEGRTAPDVKTQLRTGLTYGTQEVPIGMALGPALSLAGRGLGKYVVPAVEKAFGAIGSKLTEFGDKAFLYPNMVKEYLTPRGQVFIKSIVDSALSVKPQIDLVMQNIAQRAGLMPIKDFQSRVKTPEAFVEKIAQQRLAGSTKYDARMVNDIYGGRFVVKNPQQRQAIINSLEEAQEQGVLKILEREQVDRGTYHAYHVDFKVGSVRGEVQIHTPSSYLEAMVNRSARVYGDTPPPDVVTVKQVNAQKAQETPAVVAQQKAQALELQKRLGGEERGKGVNPLTATPDEQVKLIESTKIGKGKFGVGEIYVQEVAGGQRPVIISRVNPDGSVEGFYVGAVSPTEKSFGISPNSLTPAKWNNPQVELKITNAEGIVKGQPIFVNQNVINQAYKDIVANGGVTIDLAGKKPSEGFAYSPYREREVRIPVKEFTQQNLDDFAIKNYDVLSQPGNHIGGWTEDGYRVLDVSRVGGPTASTLQEAINSRQIGAFDLSSLKGGWDGNIPLAKIKNGVYTPLDEAINVFNQYRRKIPAADFQGGGGSVSEVPKGGAGSVPKTTGESTTGKTTGEVKPTLFGEQLEPLAQATKGVKEPPLISPKEKELGFITTVKESPRTPPKAKETLYGKYVEKPNEVLFGEAKARIDKSYDDAYKFVMEDRPIEMRELDQIIATGQLLADQAYMKGRNAEGNAIVDVLAARYGLHGGRGMQAFTGWNKFTPSGLKRYGKQAIKEAQENAGELDKRMGRVAKDLTPEEMKTITDYMVRAKQATTEEEQLRLTKLALETINQKIPWGVYELFDIYRLNNIFTNPRSHWRNIWGNFFNTYVVRPIQLTFEGRPTEAAKFELGAIKAFPKAMENAWRAMRGEVDLRKVDLQDKNLLLKLRRQKSPWYISMGLRGLGVEDAFFRTLIEAGEISRGASAKDSKIIADKLLYLTRIGDKGSQGYVLNAMDETLGKLIHFMSKTPGLNWFVPIARTPYNIAKMQLEYSPLGFATLPGAKNPREQLAKAFIGSLITWAGTNLETTFAPPIDPEAKEWWYAQGNRPFSVRIGDKIVPVIHFGPFALALMLPAMIRYYSEEAPTALSSGDMEKIGQVATAIVYYWSQQTPLAGIGTFIELTRGNPNLSLLRNLGFTSGQAIPYTGFLSYMAQVLDPIYRKPKGFGEQILSGLPGLSQNVPDFYTTPTGEPATRPLSAFIGPYTLGNVDERYRPFYEERMRELQQNKLINQIDKSITEGTSLPKGGLPLLLDKEGVLGTTSGGSPLDVIMEREKLQDLYGEKSNKLFDLYMRAPDEDTKTKIEQSLTGLGVDVKEGLYNYTAGKETAPKTEYVKAILGGVSAEQKLGTLVTLRKEGIANQKMILADGVIDNLYDEGLISASEKKYLKNVKWDSKNKNFKTGVGSGTGSGGLMDVDDIRRRMMSMAIGKVSVPQVKAATRKSVSAIKGLSTKVGKPKISKQLNVKIPTTKTALGRAGKLSTKLNIPRISFQPRRQVARTLGQLGRVA